MLYLLQDAAIASGGSFVGVVMFGAVLVLGLLLVPLGLPGLWVMLGAAIVYWIIVPMGGVGLTVLLVAGALVVLAEVLEFTIAGRYARKYGGSRRAAWGAIVGGVVGAIVGVPVPVVGSLVGAFAGAFAGALVAEFTVPRERRAAPTRVATGAVIGRAVAAAIKSLLAVIVMVVILAGAAFQ